MKITSIFVLLAASAAVAAPFSSKNDPSSNLIDRSSHGLFARKGEYPYIGRCKGHDGIDDWNFIRCSCTSYVAWCLNKADKNLNFNNWYKGVRWGNAYNWDNTAKQVDVKINKKPKVWAVAQTDKGPGHVAYVTHVSKDKKKISVEEYNYEHENRYGKRTGLDASHFKYIHL